MYKEQIINFLSIKILIHALEVKSLILKPQILQLLKKFDILT